MLVLSRRISEKIVFPSLNITVQLLQVKRGMVRLGIEAPPEVAVLRQEVVARNGQRCNGSRVEPMLPKKNDGRVIRRRPNISFGSQG
jgi:carbon storage regulator CsrA